MTVSMMDIRIDEVAIYFLPWLPQYFTPSIAPGWYGINTWSSYLWLIPVLMKQVHMVDIIIDDIAIYCWYKSVDEVVIVADVSIHASMADDSISYLWLVSVLIDKNSYQWLISVLMK